MKKLLFLLCLGGILYASCNRELAPDQSWGNQRWVVTEMKGVPVQLSSTRKDAYIQFSPTDKRLTGNAGCNRISGNYTLENKDRIRFGPVMSTKMSCDDIAFETAFLSALSSTNQYEIRDNTLLFSKEGEILLKFQSRPLN
jgi:heat shock protein HslJ